MLRKKNIFYKVIKKKFVNIAQMFAEFCFMKPWTIIRDNQISKNSVEDSVTYPYFPPHPPSYHHLRFSASSRCFNTIFSPSGRAQWMSSTECDKSV